MNSTGCRQQRPKLKKKYHCFLPLGSEMVFPRDARSKKRIWIDISILVPVRVYLYKKKVTQKFSLLSLGQQRPKLKKEYHSFLPLGSEMVFPRDARSKKRIWIDISILDPARIYLYKKM